MARHREQQWSIELPEGWSSERDEESTLLRSSEGIGTLAITLLCDKGPVDSAQLRELAASTLEEGHEPQEVEVAGYRGLYFSYHEEGTAWREWYLAAGNCLFFVSYDCLEADGREEQQQVDTMLAGLTLTR